MRPTIGNKIFGIALTVLLLMFTVAIYSIHLTAKISDELDRLALKHIPLSNVVSNINLHVVEKGGLLQRLFVMIDDHDSAHLIDQHKDAYIKLGFKIDAEFNKASQLLALGDYDKALPSHILRIQEKYKYFKEFGLFLIELRKAGHSQEFKNTFLELDQHQDQINQQIQTTRDLLAELTNKAVLKAEKQERNLLYINITLTLTASVLAIGLSIMLTRYIIRAVHNLVRGANQVEQGILDASVEITTRDEIGKLTGSFNNMVIGLRLKERIKDTFGKYIDPRIVANLIEGPENLKDQGQRREMTVMFIDLKGFTSISEKISAEDLIRMTNAFYAQMTEAISKHTGVVDKFMGDCVMAFWGEPFTDKNQHALLACKAALDAQKYLEYFRNEVREELGKDADGLEIDLRIGVSTGNMVVGPVGSKASKNYTVIGDAVNLGARLEGANKAYATRIILSERTKELAGNDIIARELDIIRVKGKNEVTKIYELLAIKGDPSPGPLSYLSDFEQGLTHYRKREWDDAIAAFSRCRSGDALDATAAVYLDRIKTLQSKELPPNWDGVWNFETK